METLFYGILKKLIPPVRRASTKPIPPESRNAAVTLGPIFRVIRYVDYAENTTGQKEKNDEIEDPKLQVKALITVPNKKKEKNLSMSTLKILVPMALVTSVLVCIIKEVQ